MRPGNKEGQVLMVKQSDGSVEAHQVCYNFLYARTRSDAFRFKWSAASGSWTKIGTVVDAVGQNRKQLFNGQEYDFVFDVDVEEGKPPLKLPYNATRELAST